MAISNYLFTAYFLKSLWIFMLVCTCNVNRQTM